MNCFFGREARPGARNSRLSKLVCMPGGIFGGYKPTAEGGNVKVPGLVGDGTGPVRKAPGGGYIPPPGEVTCDEFTPPGRGKSMAAAASLNASSFLLSAIMAIIS